MPLLWQRVMNLSAGMCAEPALSLSDDVHVLRGSYPSLLHKTPWALPPLPPLRVARSPSTAALLQLPAPVAGNAAMTTTASSHTESGVAENVAMRGSGFVEPGRHCNGRAQPRLG